MGIHFKTPKILKKAIEGVVDFVGDALHAGVNALAQVTAVFANIGMQIAEVVDNVATMLEESLEPGLEKIAGQDVVRIVSVIFYAVKMAAYTAPGVVAAIGQAIKDGKLPDLLDLLAPLLESAMIAAAKEARRRSLSLPQHVTMMIPNEDERKWVSEHVRYSRLRDLDDDAFFVVWKNLKDDQTALTLLDTIVFVDPPDWLDDKVIFLALHEIKHTLQFRAMGVHGFMKQYLMERVTKGPATGLEIEADIYACSIMPRGGVPAYLPGGVCPGGMPAPIIP